ncbi:hypothetical protein SLW70_15325 [Flavobacterium sp. NG2]|uniref:hypothetical protein n=1 Tax=Flavobacterium sp. NG2 TaxID=3097547 RepID=UPI002A817D08|nr:hypothetical protein [Flavobacterium sp. NG2]WPR71290.1 hypothetical protein SLW70_15325 [Flavobacterium sp. NG2]
MKFKIIGVVVLAIFANSCAVKSDKLQAMVSSRINETSEQNSFVKNITVNFNKDISIVTQCSQDKSSFVPAFFYWGWNSEVICEFSKETLENEFQRDIVNQIEQNDFKKYFEDKKIILNIDELPTKFKFQDKGDVVYLVVAYMMSQKRNFIPEVKEFKGAYEVLDMNDKIVFGGSFSQKHALKAQANNYKSTKKLSWQYIESYNNELNRLVAVVFNDIKIKVDSIKVTSIQ